jgi:hypothetical protein
LFPYILNFPVLNLSRDMAVLTRSSQRSSPRCPWGRLSSYRYRISVRQWERSWPRNQRLWSSS